jgi:hypothetical protein
MQKIKNPTITARLTRPFSRNRRNAIIGAAAYSTTPILQAASAAGERCWEIQGICGDGNALARVTG